MVIRHKRPSDLFRFNAGGRFAQQKLLYKTGQQVGETPRMLAEPDVVRIGKIATRPAALVFDPDDRIWVFDRLGVQNEIEAGEERRVDANPERQREDSNHGEARL